MIKFASVPILLIGILLYVAISVKDDSARQLRTYLDSNESKIVKSLDRTERKRQPQDNQGPHEGLTGEQWARVALQHIDNQRYSEALGVLNQAISRYTDADRLYAIRGSLFLDQGEISLALQDLNRAIAINPDNPDYYINRYNAYSHYKQDGLGLQDLNRAIELDNNSYAAYFNRGSLYFKKGEFANALADFNQCVAIDPHVASSYFNRASVYYELGKKSQALADLKHFIKLNKQASWTKVAENVLADWQKNIQVQD